MPLSSFGPILCLVSRETGRRYGLFNNSLLLHNEKLIFTFPFLLENVRATGTGRDGREAYGVGMELQEQGLEMQMYLEPQPEVCHFPSFFLLYLPIIYKQTTRAERERPPPPPPPHSGNASHNDGFFF